MRSSRSSTSGRPRSSGTWSCCGRSTLRRRVTAISAGRNPTSRGSAPTRLTRSGRPPGCDPGRGDGCRARRTPGRQAAGPAAGQPGGCVGAARRADRRGRPAAASGPAVRLPGSAAPVGVGGQGIAGQGQVRWPAGRRLYHRASGRHRAPRPPVVHRTRGLARAGTDRGDRRASARRSGPVRRDPGRCAAAGRTATARGRRVGTARTGGTAGRQAGRAGRHDGACRNSRSMGPLPRRSRVPRRPRRRPQPSRRVVGAARPRVARRDRPCRVGGVGERARGPCRGSRRQGP